MRHEHYKLRDNSIITIPIPENYCDCFFLAKSDFYRIKGRMISTPALLCEAFKIGGQKFHFWFRMCQYHGFFYIPFKIIYKIISKRRNLQVPDVVKVGYGLSLSHGICMVINPNTIIGNNVNLSQFLNIGSNDDTYAIVGDEVYIGPMVCVVEDVQIGCGATIGAGAVVVKDINSGSTSVGVPAKEVNKSIAGRYIKNKFPMGIIEKND